MFNPIIKTMRALREKGLKNAVIQLYTVGDIKFGVLKGSDMMGNKYYEDLDLPYGQHRWVEYADIHNFDATMIPPEWHGWMHHMYDETPLEGPKNPKHPRTIHSGSSAKYNTHVYDSKIKPTLQVNKTQFRQRGWKVGSLQTGPEDDDLYYLQSSHPLHPDAFGANSVRHKDKKSMADGEEKPQEW
eukprot:CAMPEP_0116903566 /NCGR_PEP_ID=MMETSP0467-20121206/10823_1 /TAXON_ID=283647 /ORGANISM="Mesodinium pulex, Strain SPMC105" /LENGTH=185 /DNA_ID=CAMNT_0004577891 /DNA_START=31 /DNA_END=585 /DNA_ORIENTATION=+